MKLFKNMKKKKLEKQLQNSKEIIEISEAAITLTEKGKLHFSATEISNFKRYIAENRVDIEHYEADLKAIDQA